MTEDATAVFTRLKGYFIAIMMIQLGLYHFHCTTMYINLHNVSGEVAVLSQWALITIDNTCKAYSLNNNFFFAHPTYRNYACLTTKPTWINSMSGRTSSSTSTLSMWLTLALDTKPYLCTSSSSSACLSDWLMNEDHLRLI